MSNPTDLKYTKSHEWVKFTNETTAKIGLTDYAQNSLGDIVFVNLPQAGDGVTVGESFSDVESVKAVSDIFSPFTGEISATNEEVLDEPAKINSDPYGTWLVEISGITDQEELLDAAAYEKICAEEE